MPPHTHDRAAILASGDEIITGQLLDTNSRWIAQRLVDRGILPVEHLTVPDDRPAIVEALRRAAAKAPLVIISGGLGPTEGDLTRAALAEATADTLVTDDAAVAAITAMLARRGREVTDRQLRQAQRPSNSVTLPNAFGTAPGLHATLRDAHGGTADVFCLPGPPGELKPMWLAEVEPRLRPPPGRAVATRLLHIVGVPEADAVTRLGDLTRRDPAPGTPLVGITASAGVLTLRLRVTDAPTPDEAEAALDQAEAYARRALGDHVFARADPSSGQKITSAGNPADGPGLRVGPRATTTTPGSGGSGGAGGGMELTGVEHLAREILELLKARARTLAVVESCTGGGLGELLTRIPGASAAFLGGHITYANALKEALGVRPVTLRDHGAVSRETASEMAAAGLRATGATHCLAITGIAGPEGGTPIKPVGTVHIALATAPAPGAPPAVDARRFLITGDREDIRRRAATSALAMLYFTLATPAAPVPRPTPKLLWQMDDPPA
jgi:nicotinamide-nucleotide amidase